MDLAAVAAELYALAPSAFTAARNERAKAAKAEGQALLAKQVARLPKPSVAAWSVDALARARPDALARVLALGADLRTAQEALDAAGMRELGQRRTDVLADAVQAAREAARDRGVPVSDAAAAEVEQTLRAAMADPSAAAAARSGLLIRSLVSNGLEPVDLDGAVAVAGAVPEPTAGEAGVQPAARAQTAPPRPDEAAARRRSREAARERERAEAAADLADAERRRGEAEAELADAQEQAAAAASRSGRLADELADLRRRIEALEHEAEAAEREVALAERAQRLASRVAEQEGRAVERARERLERVR